MVQQEELQKFEGTVQAPLEDTAGGASQMQVRKVWSRKGLMNLGNTCYMNAFLQAIYQIKEYREAVMSMEDGEFLNAKQEDGSFKGP